jgi:predicted dehydrogenase
MSFRALGPASIGFGLVGCGAIAGTFAAALGGIPGVSLVAVHDIDRAKGEGFAADHATTHVGSLEALLARDDVGVICVCVPSGLHAEIGLAVAKYGKHVVVEKPIDINLDAARRLIDGASAAGVSLNVISQQRYNPGVRRAKVLLDEGRLGQLLLVQVLVPWYRSQAYYDSAPWRGTWRLDGGGALMNQGVHYADLLCWLFGPPEVQSSLCATLGHDIEVEDVALGVLHFSSGAVGTLVASTVSYPGSAVALTVSASGGSLELRDGGIVNLDLKDGEIDLSNQDVGSLGMPDGHRAQLADVVSALRDGRPPPISGEDGYRALKLVLDVYRSAGWPR